MSSGGKRKPPSLEDLDAKGIFDEDDLFEASDLVFCLEKSTETSNCDVATKWSRLSDDLDYESVSSPGNSSTTSGPTYVRPAGFDHHAYEILAPSSNPRLSESSCLIRSTSSLSSHSYSGKCFPLTSELSDSRPQCQTPFDPKKGSFRKKKSLLSATDHKESSISKPKLEGMAISNRAKHKKEPLPMKQRALPQSFWQQPNVANSVPPGAIYSTLPPLCLQGDDENDLTPIEEVPSLAIMSSFQDSSTCRRPEKFISVANTDLLFSLFNSIEEDEAQRKIHIVRRGRPKKPPPAAHTNRIIRDDNPCLDSLTSDSILPLIPDRTLGATLMPTSTSGGTSSQRGSQGTQVIRIMSLSNGNRTVELPSLNVEHNYPHLLSELVLRL